MKTEVGTVPRDIPNAQARPPLKMAIRLPPDESRTYVSAAKGPAKSQHLPRHLTFAGYFSNILWHFATYMQERRYE